MNETENQPFPYLTDMRYRHIGPLNEVDIRSRFDAGGNPVPILLVGENGSGKSVLLSNIVDAFYEIGGEAFSNARFMDEGMEQAYFKIISGDQVMHGEDYLYVRLRFANECGYVFVAGPAKHAEMKKDDPLLDESLRWSAGESTFKKSSFDKKKAEDFFTGNAICYFGPNRYERPNWLGKSYYGGYDEPTGLSNRRHFAGRLETPISVEQCAEKTIQWLLDLIADSRVDVTLGDDGKLAIAHVDDPATANAGAFGYARRNVELVMSQILGEDVYFSLGNRGAWHTRLSVRRNSDGTVVVSSLDALSTGQLALFELFATIVRYADAHNVGSALHLSGIRGIVVVDEADLHLHIDMQKSLLPKLIGMFPKVQFVVSTHSPMFLLGMQDEFGALGVDIIELPDGKRVDAESFSQFRSAYQSFQSTERHRREITDAIKRAIPGKPLIITEGTTDWRHLKAAKKALMGKPDHAGLFTEEFEFLEYGPETDDRCSVHHEMGDTELLKLCEHIAFVGSDRPVVFVADCDKEDICKKMGSGSFRSWGGNVYSFTLPMPAFREGEPGICIEQMYSDEVLTSWVDCGGEMRRLFLKSEFTVTGSGPDGLYCGNVDYLRGKGSPVIDGGKVMISRVDEETNYALSKVAFANAMLDERIDLPDGAFDSFIPVFTMVREILESAAKSDGSTAL